MTRFKRQAENISSKKGLPSCEPLFDAVHFQFFKGFTSLQGFLILSDEMLQLTKYFVMGTKLPLPLHASAITLELRTGFIF